VRCVLSVFIVYRTWIEVVPARYWVGGWSRRYHLSNQDTVRSSQNSQHADEMVFVHMEECGDGLPITVLISSGWYHKQVVLTKWPSLGIQSLINIICE